MARSRLRQDMARSRLRQDLNYEFVYADDIDVCDYGMAMISRLLKITGLFCKRKILCLFCTRAL